MSNKSLIEVKLLLTDSQHWKVDYFPVCDETNCELRFKRSYSDTFKLHVSYKTSRVYKKDLGVVKQLKVTPEESSASVIFMRKSQLTESLAIEEAKELILYEVKEKVEEHLEAYKKLLKRCK